MIDSPPEQTFAPGVRSPRSRWATALLLVALGALVLPFLLLARFATSPGPLSGPPRTVVIHAGAGLRMIARSLREEDVIASELGFVALALVNRAESRLRAGEYEFTEAETPWRVLERLKSGDVIRYKVTLVEGWTVTRISKAIGSLGIASPDRLLTLARDAAFARSLGLPRETLEGYCFPDTYALTGDLSPRAIWNLLVSRFREVYAEERASAAALEGLTLTDHEIVTLASIVEKETGLPEERPLIAAVFLNRLKRGMRLQSDPTVIYGLSGFDGNLTRAHLEMPTPYNTYTGDGLPPGPIANPGRASLHAVLNAAPVDYLYFVSRNDGSHQFSRTLQEHNRAVRAYQQSGRTAPSSVATKPRQ
jgi:UPF0755 protein